MYGESCARSALEVKYFFILIIILSRCPIFIESDPIRKWELVILGYGVTSGEPSKYVCSVKMAHKVFAQLSIYLVLEYVELN